MQNDSKNNKSALVSGHAGMHWMMWICCAVMILPIVLFISNGGTLESPRAILSALLPVGLCLGLHFFMHRLPGHSCEQDKQDTQGKLPEQNDGASPVLPNRPN